MSASIKLAGVIGWPVTQSLSPLMHGHWLQELGLKGAYVPLAVRPEDFGRVVHVLPMMGFAGASVTIPHKESAFALASELDEDARAVGAVNTLVFKDEGIRGLNTDVGGFAAHLSDTLGPKAAAEGPAVVLGAGGAARAVVHALFKAGAPEIRILNRTKERAEALAKLFDGRPHVEDWGAWDSAFQSARLVVNTTSLGMVGKPALEISLHALPTTAAVADIVYNPLETDLLRQAKAKGHRTVDGLGMLMHQGVPAFAAWFGTTPKVTPALRARLVEALRA